MKMSKRTRVIPFHKGVPVGGRVTVILEPEEKLSDILEVVTDNPDREKYTREVGIITKIGPGAFGPHSPNPDPDVKVGDMAVFKKYAGHGFEDPNDKTIIYRTMNDDEVWQRIPKEVLEEVGYDSSYTNVDEKKQNSALLKAVGERNV
jgi:co-chaperonin GroES (HSP10)